MRLCKQRKNHLKKNQQQFNLICVMHAKVPSERDSIRHSGYSILIPFSRFNVMKNDYLCAFSIVCILLWYFCYFSHSLFPIYFHGIANGVNATQRTTVGQHKSQIACSTQRWIHIIMRGKGFDENGVSMVQKWRLCQSNQSDQVISKFVYSFFCVCNFIRLSA